MSAAPSFTRALVLTAGLGTRLWPLTSVRAKGAALVDGEPLVCRVIRWLVASGVSDLVLNLHHRPATIAASVGDGGGLGARVRYSWEDPVLGSAGGPRHALPLLLDEASDAPFLVVNGDTLTDADLCALAGAHAASGARVTLALIPNRWPEKYGGVQLDADGVVTGFTRRGSDTPSAHFIGVQAVSPGTFAHLPDGVRSESVLDLYPRMMRDEPGSVRGFVSEAAFRDIGTPADLLRTSLEIAGIEGRRDPRPGSNVRIEEGARVSRSVLWDDVAIGAGSSLVECVVGDGVEIPAGTNLDRCAVVCADGLEARDGERVSGGLLLAPLGG